MRLTNHRSGQAGHVALSGSTLELGAVAGAAGARSAFADAEFSTIPTTQTSINFFQRPLHDTLVRSVE